METSRQGKRGVGDKTQNEDAETGADLVRGRTKKKWYENEEKEERRGEGRTGLKKGKTPTVECQLEGVSACRGEKLPS